MATRSYLGAWGMVVAASMAACSGVVGDEREQTGGAGHVGGGGDAASGAGGGRVGVGDELGVEHEFVGRDHEHEFGCGVGDEHGVGNEHGVGGRRKFGRGHEYGGEWRECEHRCERGEWGIGGRGE